MKKKWNSFGTPKFRNYRKKILESYRILEKENLAYKVVKVKVPELDRKYGTERATQWLDRPNYAIAPDTVENNTGATLGTVYDDDILVKLVEFHTKLNDELSTTCYLKVSIPLYNNLVINGCVVE